MRQHPPAMRNPIGGQAAADNRPEERWLRQVQWYLGA
jgi:hypothetical protein